jgi:hypothetical protein
MTLEYIELVRAGNRTDIDSEEAGVASLMIGSSSSRHAGPDYLEISGGLPHCYKICPRSIPAARKWVAWLEAWIEAAEAARTAEEAADFERAKAYLEEKKFVSGEPHSGRTVYLPEFGGYFWAEDYGNRWILLACEEGDYAKGGRESESVCEVCAPESEEFLAAVNARLFTSFKMDDFAGR